MRTYPPVLVHAVVSAEDKRFFQHSGFDPIRIVKSAYVDMKARQNAQGASTLTMQLAACCSSTAVPLLERKIPRC